MKNDWILYYNPKCGTCRSALEILKQNNIAPRVIEYLKTPLTFAELQEIARKLGDQWPSMVRTKEPIFAELGLTPDALSKEAALNAIVSHPVLLQRPILVHGDQAVVARPPENVRRLI